MQARRTPGRRPCSPPRLTTYFLLTYATLQDPSRRPAGSVFPAWPTGIFCPLAGTLWPASASQRYTLLVAHETRAALIPVVVRAACVARAGRGRLRHSRPCRSGTPAGARADPASDADRADQGAVRGGAGPPRQEPRVLPVCRGRRPVHCPRPADLGRPQGHGRGDRAEGLRSRPLARPAAVGRATPEIRGAGRPLREPVPPDPPGLLARAAPRRGPAGARPGDEAHRQPQGP